MLGADGLRRGLSVTVRYTVDGDRTDGDEDEGGRCVPGSQMTQHPLASHSGAGSQSRRIAAVPVLFTPAVEPRV
jgi:hypothetical protein